MAATHGPGKELRPAGVTAGAARGRGRGAAAREKLGAALAVARESDERDRNVVNRLGLVWAVP